MNRYQIILTYDDEYCGYVAEVPGLPGCVSQGKTMDKAIANIKDAIAGWLMVEENFKGFDRNRIKEVFIGEVLV